MTKNHQIGKKLPKWLKVLKLGFKAFQGVPDGSRSQTAWARTTRGTYARAPYAFAALGQGPKLSMFKSFEHNILLLVQGPSGPDLVPRARKVPARRSPESSVPMRFETWNHL